MTSAARLNDVRSAEVEKKLHAFLRSDKFSCVGGKAASLRDAVVHSHYPEFADPLSTHNLYADLETFAHNRDSVHEHFATFIASFESPACISESTFESLLWRQLQLLHEIDGRRYPWAAGFESDPMADRFAFSIAAQAFFVIGIHRNAFRRTRRFDFPALVFNSHIQFQRLRENGQLVRIRRIVRRRELAIQGSLNPMLSVFGFRPESYRYSGRVVDHDWQCPFNRMPTK